MRLTAAGEQVPALGCLGDSYLRAPQPRKLWTTRMSRASLLSMEYVSQQIMFHRCQGQENTERHCDVSSSSKRLPDQA